MSRKMQNDNHGFSLVELIIVIAIMAILVAVMAPQLIKYIEKANVSRDIQAIDTLHSAIVIALSDGDVVADAATDGVVAEMMAGPQDVRIFLDTSAADTPFAKKVIEELSGVTTYQEFYDHLSSSPAKDEGEIMVQMNGSTIYVWINHSDRDGTRQDNTCDNFEDMETSGVIYVN